ncbi:hypothetical protein [Cupriavidus basilensis]
MTHIYDDLITLHRHRLHPDELCSEAPSHATTQTYRNQLSTLRSFLTFLGKSAESRIGRELRSQFDGHLKSYLEALPLSAHTKSDRRSHLHAWRDSFDTLEAQQSNTSVAEASETCPSSFHQILRLAVAATHEAPTTLAKRCGTSVSAIHRWLKGAVPNARAIPSLRRLERALGLEPDRLCAAAAELRATGSVASVGAIASIGFRERQRRNTKNPYLLRIDTMTSDFVSEWTAFFEYKTTKFPKFERSSRGVWRLLPEGRIGANLSQLAYRSGQGCPTAEIILGRLRAFFGFLSLPTSDGGWGLEPTEAQSLAWLAVPEAVDAFLEFMTTRSDGLIHWGQSQFAALASCLTHPRTGYLAQQPAFTHKVGLAQAERSWQAICEQTFKLCDAWKKAATQLSRDPQEPLRGLLMLQEPLAPILRAIEALDQAADAAPSGSLQESIFKRDALLLSILLANPLRARNFRLMQYRDDQSGNLYRRQDGQWRLRFNSADFKNEKGAARKNYDAPLPRALADRIVDYLDEYRPRLLRRQPRAAWVFPSSQTSGKWIGLNKHVSKITRRLIPETPSFGPHAVRHLVATDYLRKHPHDYPTVAQLLHDKLETVLAVYAHLRKDDSFGRYEAHLQAIVS